MTDLRILDDESRKAGIYKNDLPILTCDGCGKRITVEPWRFEGFVTHPNQRCGDAAAGPLEQR